MSPIQEHASFPHPAAQPGALEGVAINGAIPREANAAGAATAALTSPRILIIDDMPAIHEDFKKILIHGGNQDPELAKLEEAILGPKAKARCRTAFTIDGALCGEDGFALVQKSLAEKKPFVLAFVDVRMP
jgi:hypothetical protein